MQSTLATVFVALVLACGATSTSPAQEFFDCCDPCCAPPTAIAAYYAPPAVVYPAGAVGWTRYRPLFGDYVTRVRYGGYAPAYYVPGWWW